MNEKTKPEDDKQETDPVLAAYEHMADTEGDKAIKTLDKHLAEQERRREERAKDGDEPTDEG